MQLPIKSTFTNELEYSPCLMHVVRYMQLISFTQLRLGKLYEIWIFELGITSQGRAVRLRHLVH